MPCFEINAQLVASIADNLYGSRRVCYCQASRTFPSVHTSTLNFVIESSESFHLRATSRDVCLSRNVTISKITGKDVTIRARLSAICSHAVTALACSGSRRSASAHQALVSTTAVERARIRPHRGSHRARPRSWSAFRPIGQPVRSRPDEATRAEPLRVPSPPRSARFVSQLSEAPPEPHPGNRLAPSSYLLGCGLK